MSYTKQEKALGFRLFKCWNGSSLNVKKYKGMHSLSHLSIEMFDLDLEPIFNRKKILKVTECVLILHYTTLCLFDKKVKKNTKKKPKRGLDCLWIYRYTGGLNC